MRDLRGWLKKVEEMGELATISAELDWNEESSALNYMVGQQEGAPALLFENIKDARPGFRTLHNLFGTSKERIAAAFGFLHGKPLTELIDMTRASFHRKIPPVKVPAAKASVNENVVEGAKADITMFPAPKMWPLDGGRYLGTWDLFITRDLEDGHHNIGTYREMVKSPRELFVYWSPGKDARLQAERYWERGLPFPCASVYGPDPLMFTVSTQTLPKTESEYDYAGGLAGAGVEVFESPVTGLLLPANAEIIIEGEMRPGNVSMEGPFGEFTGYYGRPEASTPIIDVKCVRYRSNPILTCALMADYPACEQSLLFSIIRAGRIWTDLEKLGVPGIRGVSSFPEAAGGFGATVVSIEQRYPGHASQVASLAAQVPAGAYYAKWIIVVDDDIDPTDIHQVMWAMSTRADPATDIDVLRETWSTYLDPTKNPPEERPYGSKALINACKDHKHLKQFSKRSRLRREVYERLVQRWGEFGLKFPPPRITNFEGEEGKAVEEKLARLKRTRLAQECAKLDRSSERALAEEGLSKEGAAARAQNNHKKTSDAGDWKLMDDPANIGNRIAGNGGDLVKHTVYLATLRFLLKHDPWSQGLYLRECHAGRGIYHIPIGDPRCRLLHCLYSNPATTDTFLLQSAQRILGARGCWPDAVEELQWYAGSALVNAFALDSHPGLHTLDLYEKEPQTRRILRSVLTCMNFQARLSVSVLPAEEQDQEFDGEAYIKQAIVDWGKRDVVLLDPFAMWRQSRDQGKRDRYGAIVDALVRLGANAPSLILFWTWGNDFRSADGDLNGTNEPANNGYQELLAKFENAGFRFVLIKWRWALQFAMWVVVPQEHLAALRYDIDMHCRLLSDHLVRHGCGQNLSHPTVEVEINRNLQK